MRILVDMDEVCCKFVQRVVEWYNEDNGTSVTEDDIQTFDMKMGLGPQGEAFIRSYLRYPKFFEELEPIEGAVDGIEKLVSDGHDVAIATAIPKCAGIAYESKVQWIRKHLPGFDLKKFIAASEKHQLRGDVLFDDGLHNLEPWHAQGRLAVAMTRPWNRLAEYLTRVSSWHEFVRLIDSKERES